MGLALFLLAAVVPSAAVAATPKCFGKKATIVSSSSEINGTKKDDVIFSKATSGFNTINGRGGNDLICGSGKFDLIAGGPGNDKLRGRGSFDFLEGDTGNDHLYGDKRDGGNADQAWYQYSFTPVNINFSTGRVTGEGTDVLHGMDGAFGSQFADTMTGDDRTNFFWGNDGDDNINGAGGLDLITPGPGNDIANGGAGAVDSDLDIFYVNDATGASQVDLENGTATGAGIGTDSIDEFESIVGSSFDDTLEGDGESNFLFGGPGNDVLDGAGGFDYAAYWFAAAAVTANLQTGVATGDPAVDAQGAQVGEGTDQLLNVEGLLGTIGFADTLTGDNQGNYIDGDGGDDRLSGGGGDDWFVGGLGNDTVDGGNGNFDFWDYYGGESITANLLAGTVTTDSGLATSLTGVEAVAGADQPDVLIGDDAANYLYGWAGNDQLTGGAGNDEIEGGNGTDSGDAGAGTDTCALTESVANCESQVDLITRHPLQTASAAVTNLRRNF